MNPDTSAAATPRQEGSWWLCCQELAARAFPEIGSARRKSQGAAQKGYAPLGDAPGMYVLER